MARFPLDFAPGIYRDGTAYQSRGRWRDSWGVRWYGSALGPINGWQRKGSDVVTGKARAALAWKDNQARTWLAVGTHSSLYICDRAGELFDITPTGFGTGGRPDAISAGGYGTGFYGTGLYGIPRPDNTLVLDATQWSLDTWGENLLGVSPDEGTLYQWELDTGTAAAPVAGAPKCDALVVTAERFVFALGPTDSVTHVHDPRTVKWCDQEDNTDWTPTATNQAGSFPLQTAGRLMCGQRVKGGTLLFTDLDAHLATYIGGTLVYGFDRVGEGCGVISRQAVASFEQQAAWMSPNGFWLWNGGGVVPLPCTVLDYVRQDINLQQMSKVVATVNSANFEVEWRYCSASSIEIDRCVVWQYKDNYWTVGRAARTCGVDRGVFQYPVLVDQDGAVWDHEVGRDYGGDTPFARTGPIELGNGDQIAHVLGLVPDDTTAGDVTASFIVRRNPDDVGQALGPYSLSARTDLRFSAGLVEMTVTGARDVGWRFGTPRLDVVPGEGR